MSAGVVELETGSAEAEREFAWLARAGRAGEGSRARRVRDKLRAEIAALRDAYTARRDRCVFLIFFKLWNQTRKSTATNRTPRWSRCQAQWAGLYAALEECGEWLDGAERALETAHATPDDARRTLRDLEKQMSSYRRQVRDTNYGKSVLSIVVRYYGYVV